MITQLGSYYSKENKYCHLGCGSLPATSWHSWALKEKKDKRIILGRSHEPKPLQLLWVVSVNSFQNTDLKQLQKDRDNKKITIIISFPSRLNIFPILHKHLLIKQEARAAETGKVYLTGKFYAALLHKLLLWANIRMSCVQTKLTPF